MSADFKAKLNFRRQQKSTEEIKQSVTEQYQKELDDRAQRVEATAKTYLDQTEARADAFIGINPFEASEKQLQEILTLHQGLSEIQEKLKNSAFEQKSDLYGKQRLKSSLQQEMKQLEGALKQAPTPSQEQQFLIGLGNRVSNYATQQMNGENERVQQVLEYDLEQRRLKIKELLLCLKAVLNRRRHFEEKYAQFHNDSPNLALKLQKTTALQQTIEQQLEKLGAGMER